METTLQRMQGVWGWAGTGAGGLLPHFHSESKCAQALCRRTLTAAAPAWRALPGIVLTPWRQLWVGCACASGAAVGSLASGPGQGWGCSQTSLVLEDYIWFLFLLFWITILPIPSCLSPS